MLKFCWATLCFFKLHLSTLLSNRFSLFQEQMTASSLPLYLNHNRVFSPKSQLTLLTILTALVFYLGLFTDFVTPIEQRIIDEELLVLNRYTSYGKGANPYNPVITEERLAKYYEYNLNSTSKIPKNIYQMWKHQRSHPDFPYRELGERWLNMNPNYKYIFNTNEQLIEQLQDEFRQTVPEITMALEMLPTLILKSDFSRYLIVYLYGGMYGDLDTYLRWPVDSWWDSNRNIGFVCGLESDPNRDDWQNSMQRRLQMEQWFFKSQPHHPILRKLIATIVKTTFQARKDEKLRPYYKEFQNVDRCKSVDIMDWTGPGVFTDVIYAYLNSLKNPNIIDINPKRNCGSNELHGPEVEPGVAISWKFLTCLQDPVLIDDVMVHPVKSFRGFAGECETCYMNHNFLGAWKNNKD